MDNIPTIEINADKIPEMRERLNKAIGPSKLDQMVDDYGLLLTRQKETKKAIRDLENAAQVHLNCSVKAFKTYATAVWKDALESTQNDLEDQLSLFGGEK